MTPELIISFLALFGSAYAIWQTEKQNRLLVVPHLDWSRNRTRDPNGTTVALILRNTGLGPAIVLERQFLFDGKKHESKSGDAVAEMAVLLFGTSIPYLVRKQSVPGIGCIIPVGESHCIAEIFFPGTAFEKAAQLEKDHNVDFEIRYRSIRGQEFTLSTRN